MNESINSLYELAVNVTPTKDTELFSEMLEQESRRYSRRLEEEEEARLR